MTKYIRYNIEEKLGEVAEKEQHWNTSFYSAIGAFLGFGGIASFFYIKN